MCVAQKLVIDEPLFLPSQMAIIGALSRAEGSLNERLVVRLKIVMFAPIPSARQNMAVAANAALRRKARAA
jgi:hypothetical protein